MLIPSNTASLRCFICTIPKIRQEYQLGFQWVHETDRNFPDKVQVACNTTEWTPHTGFSTMLWHSLQSRENLQWNPHCICRSCAPAAPILCALFNQNHSLNYQLDNGCKAENATGQVFCYLLPSGTSWWKKWGRKKKSQLHNSQISQKNWNSALFFFFKYSTIMAQNTTTM